MTTRFGRLVATLWTRWQTYRRATLAPLEPHTFAKGEFAGRRRSIDR